MALYLVNIPSNGSLPVASTENIEKYKAGIEKLQAKGSVLGAYVKVGGGIVLVLNSPSNAQLTLELRKHFITQAEVVPLVQLTDVLDAHLGFRKTGKAAV